MEGGCLSRGGSRMMGGGEWLHARAKHGLK